jgi:hypothetical protein
MRQAPSWQDDPEAECRAADRQTASLAGLAVALLVIVVGLFLVHRLHREGMIEDCLLAGRGNCAPIEEARAGVRAGTPP